MAREPAWDAETNTPIATELADLDEIFGPTPSNGNGRGPHNYEVGDYVDFDAIDGIEKSRDSAVGPRTIRLTRILEGEPPAPPTLAIERFLLANEINMVAGHGDAGKGVTTAHVALCHATGRAVFGTLAVTRPGAVALLVPEDGEAAARHRLDAIGAALKLTADERQLAEERVFVVGSDRAVNLLTDCTQLAEVLGERRVSFLVADPVASLIGGQKEDDERVANVVCRRLTDLICRPLGCTVAMVHHLRKPGQGNADAEATKHDLKGSAGWSNHARAVWSVSKPVGGTTITLQLVKCNALPTGLRHEVTLEIDAEPSNAAHWRSCSLRDANAGVASLSFTAGIGRAINDNERKALESIDDRQEPGRRVSLSEWQKTSGLNADTLKSIKKRLIHAGLAAAFERGEHKNGGKLFNYSITPIGIEALETGWSRDAGKGERVKG